MARSEKRTIKDIDWIIFNINDKRHVFEKADIREVRILQSVMDIVLNNTNKKFFEANTFAELLQDFTILLEKDGTKRLYQNCVLLLSDCVDERNRILKLNINSNVIRIMFKEEILQEERCSKCNTLLKSNPIDEMF